MLYHEYNPLFLTKLTMFFGKIVKENPSKIHCSMKIHQLGFLNKLSEDLGKQVSVQ